MNDMLKDLHEYFENNSQEKIASDWAKSEKYDLVGPTVYAFSHNGTNLKEALRNVALMTLVVFHLCNYIALMLFILTK